MMRRLTLGIVMALCAAASFAEAPVRVHAQSFPDSAATSAEQPPSGTPAGASTAVVPATGLPPRAAPPRTMADQWPVFLLFALTWIGIVGYLMATGRRTGRLASGLAALEERR